MLFVLLAVALCIAAQPAHAHNYIKSLHRADGAAVSNPCQARIGNQPHVQVRAGQTFEVEWSMGHGDSTKGPYYFTVIHESAYLKLRADNISAILKDYVALAPSSAYLNSSSKWNRHHIRNKAECASTDPTDPTGLETTNCMWQKYFKEKELSVNHTDYIQRDPVYMTKSHPSQYKTAANIVQTRMTDAMNAFDKRVSYASAKYPSVIQIAQHTLQHMTPRTITRSLL